MNVTLTSKWPDIFPKGTKPTERRSRWAAWLRLARAADARDAASNWNDGAECDGCAHRRGGWCCLQGLPCSVNPILTMRHNLPGMACMGMGRTPKQLDLSLRHNDGGQRNDD